MTRTSYQILKTEKELKIEAKKIEKLFSKIEKTQFWASHFRNNKFIVKAHRFDWNYWNDIPFSSKKDLLKVGLQMRLKDVKNESSKQTHRFFLNTTSGTTKDTVPMLILRKSRDYKREMISTTNVNTLSLIQGRTRAFFNLLPVLYSNSLSFGQYLLVNPFTFNNSMIDSISQFNVQRVITFPASIPYITSTHSQAKAIFSKIKYVEFTGDFVSLNQWKFFRRNFPKANIRNEYGMAEIGYIGINCQHLQKKYDTNAYHPHKNCIVELIDIDENGYGEIVVTKVSPMELAYIRYKTGDIARAIQKKCKCGSKWIFFLAGRKDMDYIKSLGVLVTRTELERVLRIFEDEIVEWQGEVREEVYNRKMLGKLTLVLRPRGGLKISNTRAQQIREKISNELKLTPKKTLAKLVKEEKFMPLKVEFATSFEKKLKNILLRKIVN